jgi:negative regulator of flagellin synthesis FlgM
VKISGSGSTKPVAPTGATDVTPAKTAGTQGPASPAPARDKVEITMVSAQLAQIEKMLSEVGIVDTARVEQIKQAIAEGKFRVDSEVLTRGLGPMQSPAAAPDRAALAATLQDELTFACTRAAGTAAAPQPGCGAGTRATPTRRAPRRSP